MSEMLVSRVNEVPPRFAWAPKQVDYYHPEEIARRYHQLRSSVRATSGYPPFVQHHWGRSALPHLPQSERAAARARLDEADRLRDQFEHRRDPNAVAYNDRLRRMIHVLRVYRGELIYAMMKTGDDRMLNLVIDTIERNLREGNHIAFDLMSFVYQAAFDGYLDYYSDAAITSMQRRLEQMGRRWEGYRQYDNVHRSFGDYAFHLVQTLKEGARFTRTDPFVYEVPEVPDEGQGGGP